LASVEVEASKAHVSSGQLEVKRATGATLSESVPGATTTEKSMLREAATEVVAERAAAVPAAVGLESATSPAMKPLPVPWVVVPRRVVPAGNVNVRAAEALTFHELTRVEPTLATATAGAGWVLAEALPMAEAEAETLEEPTELRYTDIRITDLTAAEDVTVAVGRFVTSAAVTCLVQARPLMPLPSGCCKGVQPASAPNVLTVSFVVRKSTTVSPACTPVGTRRE